MKLRVLTTNLALVIGSVALADGGHAIHQDGAIMSSADISKVADFDILAAHAHRDGNTVTFHITTSGSAGASVPTATGAVGGSDVWSYVWPTSLDPSAVGFEAGTGILALAATSHPDFDDTPLYDENGDGDPANDGIEWHSHWVVLAPTEACGANALAVRDIPEGTSPKLPATWPGLPIYLDSPGFTPLFDGPEVSVNVSFASDVDLNEAAYDGITTALRVNTNIHTPLLCVTNIFDIASGDLSLPGKLH
ncbi:hypothetical protein [Phaeobacter sp. C3_T13_0]|uniref:hypothetical protein n=1 Tax=Phaeobacter cretensis TaxID=3342641 RepID=UPI0039BD4AE5